MKKLSKIINYLFIIICSIFYTEYMLLSTKPIICFFIAFIFLYLSNNFKKILTKTNLKKSNKILIILFSMVFSFVAIIGSKIHINANLVSGSYLENYMSDFAIIDIFGYIALIISNYVLIIYIIYFMNKYLSKLKIKNNIGIESKSDVIIGTTILFVLWIPWLVTYFPGVIFSDTIFSINQALNIQHISNKFTVLYTYLLKIFIGISKFFKGNVSIGLFLLSFFQLLYIAFAQSTMINWLKNKGVHKVILIILFIYFGTKSFFVSQNISMSRDPIFSISIMLLTLNLIDYIISKGALIKNKWFIIKNILLMVIICLSRNNGFCVLLFISLIIFVFKIFKITKIKFKFLGFTTLFFGIFYLAFLSPLYTKLKMKEPFIDTVSTMMQQMASVVVYEGNINTKEYEYLNNLTKIENYKYDYRPNWIDMLKWSGRFDLDYLEKHKKEFFITYFSLFYKNPYQYFKGYVMNTYGYWVYNRYELNDVVDNITLSDNERINRTDLEGIQNINILENKYIDFKKIFSLEDKNISLAIINWFILFICLIAIIYKKSIYIIALAPSLGLFLSLLLATPNAYWQRYGLAEYYLLPIYIFMLLFIINKEKNKK